jgi:2-polyprenyl-3-methyl-5-hydroxy-6-metoxy-1,4-benzoquinol methylase
VGETIFNLDLCSACRYCFVNPRPSIAFLMEFYSSFGNYQVQHLIHSPTLSSVLSQEHSDPNSTIDAKRLINTINSLSPENSNKRFLDVGCGTGFFSKEAISSGYKVSAIELADVDREIAKEFTGLIPSACSFEEYKCPPQSFDVILMSQILEHAMDINQWAAKARNSLTENGIIAIALPNFESIFRSFMKENDPYICPPAHLNFFNETSLSKLLIKHGFKIEETQWVSRIPKRSFNKRVPKFGKPLLPIIRSLSSATLKAIDFLHRGIMINIYARKLP